LPETRREDDAIRRRHHERQRFGIDLDLREGRSRPSCARSRSSVTSAIVRTMREVRMPQAVAMAARSTPEAVGRFLHAGLAEALIVEDGDRQILRRLHRD
jgi:hypothetical protein